MENACLESSCAKVFWSGTKKHGERNGYKEGDLNLYTVTTLILLHVWTSKSNRFFSLTLILCCKRLRKLPYSLDSSWKSIKLLLQESARIATSFSVTNPAFPSCLMHLMGPVSPTRSPDDGVKCDRHIAFRAISGSYKNLVQLPKLYTLLTQ